MKKHGTDLLSLIFGLIFAALVAWWAIYRVADVDTDGRWLLVGGLAVLGVVILAGTVGRQATRPAPVEQAPVTDEPVDEDVSEGESPTAILGGDEWPSYDPEARRAEASDAPRADAPAAPSTGDLTAAVRHPDDPEPGLRS